MSCKVYFFKYIVFITVCGIALFLITINVKINFRRSNLRSTNCVQAFPEKSFLIHCHQNDAVDMQESMKFMIVYNLTRQSKGNYKCVTMRVVPPTKICLHDLERDLWVSRIIAKSGQYNPGMVSEFKHELLKDDKLAVLDIGSNIGVYTLYAATMGRKVVAVEPFLDNVVRLHKAAILGGVQQKIVLLQNAVADKRGESMLKLSSDNQGLTNVIKKQDCNKNNCPPTIKTILLSDLRYITTISRAIMKIDIQGFEPKAFTTFESLIKQIFIPVIFMEWEFFHPVFKAQLDHKSVQNMMQVLTKSGYLPYRPGKGKMLDIKQHQLWPYNVVWRRNSSSGNFQSVHSGRG